MAVRYLHKLYLNCLAGRCLHKLYLNCLAVRCLHKLYLNCLAVRCLHKLFLDCLAMRCLHKLWTHMPEWREMTEQIDWREKQSSQVACFSEDLKCWGAWDTTGRHKAKDITSTIAWRRGVDRGFRYDDLPSKDERGPSSITQHWKHSQSRERQRWGNFWKTGRSACGLFRAHIYHLELNRSELHKLYLNCLHTLYLNWLAVRYL